MLMSSDSKPLAGDSNVQAPAFVYTPPRAPVDGTKPPSPGGNPTTLERLWTGSGPSSPGPPPIGEEEVRTREARAHKAGREAGVAQSAADLQKKLDGERQSLAEAVHQFTLERANYFQHVEAEVVALALAIARKILHREAQVDPLLLAGVVRVGLDKVAVGTRVRLRVHPTQVPAWKDFFSQQSDLQRMPELMGDPSLGLAHCVLETDLGSTDLTLESQLKEIEQGFFDLLAQRPQKPS